MPVDLQPAFKTVLAALSGAVEKFRTRVEPCTRCGSTHAYVLFVGLRAPHRRVHALGHVSRQRRAHPRGGVDARGCRPELLVGFDASLGPLHHPNVAAMIGVGCVWNKAIKAYIDPAENDEVRYTEQGLRALRPLWIGKNVG